MSDASSRFKLLDQQLSVSPDIAASFDAWTAQSQTGKRTKLDGEITYRLDQLLLPVSAQFSREVGPDLSLRTQSDLDSAFGKAAKKHLDLSALAELAVSLGKRSWPNIVIPQSKNAFTGKAVTVGKMRPDGTEELDSGVNLIAGIPIDLKMLYRRYPFSSHIDVSPVLFLDLSIAFARGVGIAAGNDQGRVTVGVSVDQRRSLSFGITFKVKLF